MWFRSIFLKTLRESWVAVLGWGAGMGLLMFELLATVNSLVTNAAAASTLTAVTSSFAWAGDPVALNTASGYATWKTAVVLPLTAIWALIAASRILRGAEERGSMDVLLAQPRGRLRVAVESLLAVWVALLGMGLLVALITFGGGASAHADFTFGASLLFGLNLALTCGVFASIALLVSQFTVERTAASGITGGLLFFFILLDMLHRVVSGTDWLSHLSPIYYFNLSKPIVPSFGTNFGAMAALLAISVVLSAAAILIFLRRDIGRVSVLSRGGAARTATGRATTRRQPSLPVGAWSLRSLYARGLASLVRPTIWWTIGVAGFAGFAVLVVKQTEDKLASILSGSTFFTQLMNKVGGGEVGTNAVLLSALLILLPMLSMAFAVTQASRWASDEEEGRQELVLSTPHPRLRVILSRFGALSTAAVFICVVTLAVTALAASASGLALDSGNLIAATLSIIPQCLLMGAVGYLGSGWLRTALETGLLSFLLVIWFFISFIGPEVGFSQGVLRASAFYYYGSPLVHGLPLGDMVIVIGVGVVALAIASVRFARKDIGRA